MSNLKIKGHTSPGIRKRNVREDYGRKKQAHFKVSNGTTVIRCRTRYFEQPPPKRKTAAASATGKDSLENLTKQRIDLVTEQLARDRSNQKSGGSSYRRMRPVGLPEGVAEGRGWGRGWRRAPNCGVSTVEGAWTPKIEGETEEKSVNWQGKGETEIEKEREMV